MGSSIAYHLARQGRRVTVIDRAEPATAPVASWASAGGVRRQGRHPAEAALANEAIERWRLLQEELDADLSYRREGLLRLAATDEEADQLVAFVQEQHANGFDDVRLVDRTEASAIAPGIDERFIAASYAPEDGHANPGATTRAFAAAAQRHGASYRHPVEVLSLRIENGQVRGVQTTIGVIEAEQTVLAAGAWSDELAESAGVCVPVRTTALQMLLTTPAPIGTLRPVLSALNTLLSLKQLPGGEFLLGGGWPGDVGPDRRSCTVRPESVDGNWSAAYTVFPPVGAQRIARSWCGLEAQSFDRIPLIGSIPGLERLAVATGFSGHGFAIAPAVGRSVADHLAGRATPELDGLRPERIACFDRSAVEQFLREPAEGLAAG